MFEIKANEIKELKIGFFLFKKIINRQIIYLKNIFIKLFFYLF